MKTKITLIIMLTSIFLAGLLFFGCASPAEAYIKANYYNGRVAIPDLKEYIQEDKNIPKKHKEYRIKSLSEWLKLIETEYKELKKNE